jgi:predicted transcriptional regulator
MTALSVRLPDSLHKRLKELAVKEGVSINQLISLAVTEKVSALLTEDYLNVRAARASREKFDAAMSLVPDAEPVPEDRLP